MSYFKSFGHDILANRAVRFTNTDDLVMKDIKRRILEGNRSSVKTLSLDDMDLERDDLGMEDLVEALMKDATDKSKIDCHDTLNAMDGLVLPKVITFPYSRHSSYEELCHLIGVFNPMDIYPCTVNEKIWESGMILRARSSNES